MRCVVVRKGERLLLRVNEKTLLEPPPEMRVLPGALVEVESRYEVGRGMIVTRIEEVLAPGGGTPVGEARAYRDRGLPAEALATLGELADPAARATRARVEIDLGRHAAATGEVRAVLESGEGDAAEPWDVASLLEALDEPSRAPLIPLLGAWLAKTQLAPGSQAVQRAMKLAPSSAWTTPQLFARLAGSNAGETLAAVVAEMRSRGIDDARLATAEATLTKVESRENAVAAAKRAHQILQAALRAAHKSVKPPPPYHLGGPAPRLAVRDLVAVLAFCLERIRPLALRDEIQHLDGARNAISAEPVDAPAIFELMPEPDTPASEVVFHVLSGALGGDPYHLQANGKKAAASVVKSLQKAKRPEDATAFIRDLDALLVEREWRTLAAAHPESAPAIADLVWRGDDGKKALGHVLVQTKDGGLALLSKSARRWRWHTGSRDDVLSTIPDQHFAAAIAQLKQ